MSSLFIKNFESRCSIAIGNGTASTGSPVAALLNGGGPFTIHLAASASSDTFALGPALWHHTDGDAGSGDAGTVAGTGTTATSTATITIGTDSHACVWACCPLADGTNCPTTDQCP